MHKRNATRTFLVCLLAVSLSIGAVNVEFLPRVKAEDLQIYVNPLRCVFSRAGGIGRLFNVTCWVNTTRTDLGGFQVCMEFNDSILAVTRWYVPDSDPRFFMPLPYVAFPSPPDPYYVHSGLGLGRVTVAIQKGPSPPSPPYCHSGEICILEFNITALPSGPEVNLTSVLNIDNSDTFAVDSGGDRVDGMMSNGCYEQLGTYPHDVAVTSVTPERDAVTRGEIVDIQVEVANFGSYLESFSVSVYADLNTTFIGDEISIGTRNTTLNGPGGHEVLNFSWNTEGVAFGNYTLSAMAQVVPGDINASNNLLTGGVVQIVEEGHDVAVTSVTPSATIVLSGMPLQISVTVANQGIFYEVSTLTVYANTTVIGLQPLSLAMESNMTYDFSWYTLNCMGAFDIRAVVDRVSQESDIADNTLDYGVVNVVVAHDIAVTALVPSSYSVLEGMPVQVNVTVANQGFYGDSFVLTLYLDELLMETHPLFLPSQSNWTESFTWYATGAVGDHVVSANTSIVPLEDDISNNEMSTWINVYADYGGSGGQTPQIYISPGNATLFTQVGDRFNVTVCVWAGSQVGWDYGGVEVCLEFNDSIINATRWFLPTDRLFIPPPISFLPNPLGTGYHHICEGNGMIDMWAGKMFGPPPEPWRPSGQVIIIEFEVTALPPWPGNVTTALKINNPDTCLMHWWDPISPLEINDGYYTLVNSLPTGVIGVGLVVSKNAAVQGERLNVEVNVANDRQARCEAWRITVCAETDMRIIGDEVVIGTQNAWVPSRGFSTMMFFGWDTSQAFPGNFTICAKVEIACNGSDVFTEVFIGSVVQIIPCIHDVAVTDIRPWIQNLYTGHDLWVFQGLPVYFNVTVSNRGNLDESATITLCDNSTADQLIGAQNVTLSPGLDETVTFVWDTVGVPYCQNYTITAVATIPLGNNPADNTLACGPIYVRILGDLNGDGKVNLKDVFPVALAFGTVPGDSRWNSDADMNGDSKINLCDFFTVCLNYGKTDT